MDKIRHKLKEIATQNSAPEGGDYLENVHNIDIGLLQQRIDESGLKIGFICEKLGISYQAFDKKRKGLSSFKAAEVFVLTELLHLSMEDKLKIFCL